MVISPSKAPPVVALQNQESQVAQSLRPHVDGAPPAAAYPAHQQKKHTIDKEGQMFIDVQSKARRTYLVLEKGGVGVTGERERDSVD